MRYFALTLFCASTFMLFACGGGGADIETHTTNTTMGQELMDLKASRDAGIITQGEYEDAKENIMDKYDN